MQRIWPFLIGLVVLGIGAFLITSNPTTPTYAQDENNCPPLVPQLNIWETDFTQSNIDCDEIISGGVPRDGIPPIDNPEFDSIEVASEWLQDQSPVIAVEIDGQARAYPLAIMTRHEIVNDQLAGLPIAVTYCPLCNSALVFESEFEGQVHRFGVSGLLRNSDLVMWDDVTESWWQQLTGEGIVGEYTGRQLTILPTQLVSFEAFVAQYPQGEVLSPGGRNYGTNPYLGYDSDPQPFLFRGEIDERVDNPVERVLAGTIDGQPIAYPFSVLEDEQVINDVVGEEPVVAIWQPGKVSALDDAVIDESRDVGMAALYNRILEIDGEDVVLTFSIQDGAIIDDETESTWNIFGEATDGPLTGSQLRQELAAPHLWFSWAAFRPETAVYGIEEATE
jgi:hypothetical protein